MSNISPYGSHASMVIEEFEDGLVLCEDSAGQYVTFANRLDSGLADPKRYNRPEAIEKLTEKREKPTKKRW